ncbi:MAG: MerR family transcriptional regulator [Firmicutes bacterium]|nr:MerR family transcriptional regulator [Bacillota bacterium]
MDENHILISQMAEMHNLSRQTLIYYDRCGLFKPAYRDENGYRYYSLYQIPFLREICLMKEMGFSLKEIKESFEDRDADLVCALMESRLKKIKAEIFELEQKKKFLQDRIKIYDHFDTKIKDLNMPHIRWLPERQVIFVPFEEDHIEKIEKNQLHLTLMKAWNILLKHKMVPSRGFGALLRYDSICQNTPLRNAGSIINLPFAEYGEQIENLYTIPEGEYAILYKYGMPYDTEPLCKFLDWIEEHHFKITGDIVDLCLLDTTFYNSEHHVDFCCLQAPIE